MKVTNISLFLGGFFGFFAIALGAYADHVLKPTLSLHDYDGWQTALRYQLIHGVILCVLGLAQYVSLPIRAASRLRYASYFLIIGIILFSEGIEGSILLHADALLQLAPLGGVSFMVGWLTIVAAAF